MRGDGRQQHAERGALVEAGAVHFDRAAVQLDQVPRDREPQAEAAMCARRAGVALAETIEDIRQELRHDANPAVGHREPDGSIGSVECHAHPSAGGRELQRV
jgi:hypothetical protein